MEFTSTKFAVRLAEHAVVDRPPLWQKDDAVRALTEEVLIGPWLVMKGFAIVWKRVAWGLVATVLFSTLVEVVDTGSSGSAWLAAMMFGAGCVYFGLPTRTVLAGVSEEPIQRVSEGIQLQVKNADALDRLSSGVQVVKLHAMERLGRLNVFVGVVWGALFWFVSARVLSPDVSLEVLRVSVPWVYILGLFFCLLFVAAVSYAAAVRAVFQTLDFALIEVRGRLSGPAKMS